MTDKTKSSMMRVTAELVDDLKLLKEVKAVNGKLGTHNDIVHELVKAELRKTHAETCAGFLPEGAVVLGPSSKPVVIRTVSEGNVTFNDNTYVINGGIACKAMKLLAESIESFDGGTVDV
jgi:hypothetical protein